MPAYRPDGTVVLTVVEFNHYYPSHWQVLGRWFDNSTHALMGYLMWPGQQPVGRIQSDANLPVEVSPGYMEATQHFAQAINTNQQYVTPQVRNYGLGISCFNNPVSYGGQPAYQGMQFTPGENNQHTAQAANAYTQRSDMAPIMNNPQPTLGSAQWDVIAASLNDPYLIPHTPFNSSVNSPIMAPAMPMPEFVKVEQFDDLPATAAAFDNCANIPDPKPNTSGMESGTCKTVRESEILTASESEEDDDREPDSEYDWMAKDTIKDESTSDSSGSSDLEGEGDNDNYFASPAGSSRGAIRDNYTAVRVRSARRKLNSHRTTAANRSPALVLAVKDVENVALEDNGNEESPTVHLSVETDSALMTLPSVKPRLTSRKAKDKGQGKASVGKFFKEKEHVPAEIEIARHVSSKEKLRAIQKLLYTQRKSTDLAKKLGTNITVTGTGENASISGVYWFCPRGDSSLPENEEEMAWCVNEIIEAMWNNVDTREKNTTQQFKNRWAIGATFYQPHEIKAVAAELVATMIDVHMNGWTKNVYDKDQRELYQKTMGFTFAKRHRGVCELLFRSKTTCQDLLKNERLWAVVGNPIALLNRTASNTASNKMKADRIAVATKLEAEGKAPLKGSFKRAHDRELKRRELTVAMAEDDSSDGDDESEGSPSKKVAVAIAGRPGNRRADRRVTP